MLITIDLDSLAPIQSPSYTSPVSRYSFKRGVTTSIPIQFARAGIVQELDPAEPFATGKFMLKEDGAYDGPAVISSAAWTKSGAGSGTLYTFQPNFDTGLLRTLLGIDPPNVTNDRPSITLMGEIEWTTAAGKFKTQPWKATINNCIITDDEEPPVELVSSAKLVTDIPIGAMSVDIVFPSPLNHVPTVVQPTLYIPSGAPGFAVWPDYSTITAEGYTAVLGGIPLVAGYKLASTAF